jgi:hypothetical protein
MTGRNEYKSRTMQVLAGVAFAGILVNGIIQRELNPNEPVQYNVPASISEEYQVEDPVEIPVSPEWVDTNVVSGLENKVNTNVPSTSNQIQNYYK